MLRICLQHRFIPIRSDCSGRCQGWARKSTGSTPFPARFHRPCRFRAAAGFIPAATLRGIGQKMPLPQTRLRFTKQTAMLPCLRVAQRKRRRFWKFRNSTGAHAGNAKASHKESRPIRRRDKQRFTKEAQRTRRRHRLIISIKNSKLFFAFSLCPLCLCGDALIHRNNL